MKWQAFVVASVVCGLVAAQVPAAPPGGVKVVPRKTAKPIKSDVARVLERAKSMRRGITTGRPMKSHVKVRVRLQNGNRLAGVVKDGRLVERVDGLRFVDAQALDAGAGIRLWYSGGTRSYIFVPFVSLKNYEVVQRLSQQQLLAMENEMQMAEKRASEREARAMRRARGSAMGTVPAAAPETMPAAGPEGVAGRVAGLSNFAKPGQAPVKLTGNAVGTATGTAAVTTNPGAAKTAPARVGAADAELDEAKKKLAWSNLLRSYPPKDGWNEAKKNEIARRRAVIGVPPTKFELAFVKSFDQWMQACEHNGVDPNAGVVKKPQTKRERRLAERASLRGK